MVVPIDEPKPVLVHAVYFWLNDNISDQQKQQFVAALKGLKKIKSVKKIFIGHPANTPRAEVDNSYDVALVIQFRDRAGHDAYQTDPVHVQIGKDFPDAIARIQVYDCMTE